MRLLHPHHLLVFLAIVSPLMGGCSILGELSPAVETDTLHPGEFLKLKRGDILTRGTLSNATVQTVRAAGLEEEACATPISSGCVDAFTKVADISEDQQLAAISELWLARAQTISSDPERLAAWLEVVRYAYAYLFFGNRQPGERAFEYRQTQIQDWYNYAVAQAATQLFETREQGTGHDSGTGQQQTAGWAIQLETDEPHFPSVSTLPSELLPASAFSFRGLRSVYRRDGIGAEMVAVMPDESLAETRSQGANQQPKRDRELPSWSEMPTPSITITLRPDGEDLQSVLHTQQAYLTVHNPYIESAIVIQGQRTPLAANFTAGYGLWLARSDFRRQSLRSLFGRKGSIDRPHVYLMQRYDPNKRIIVMLHGLASSPEAWVDLANEVLGDETLRQHFQIWQIYYPTNLPIALNHAAIRKALSDTLAHFDPSGQAPASSNLVLVGHSMGGVLARLMVSTTDQSLVKLAENHSQFTPQQIKRIEPILRFEPFPSVNRAIFLATPHRGTKVAAEPFGRWMAGLIRFPVRVLEELTHILAPRAAAIDRQGKLPDLSNSLDNLSEKDPFVRTAADLPISPRVRYHSIVARSDPDMALADSDDGLVPYRSAHLPGAYSEKAIISGHSVQKTAGTILEIKRILKEDIAQQGPSQP
ncbi:alpha/beta fold hydrolase [uncultured Marinobacter sp.]|uniref:esterase/lipase family protein n=1 Tax=uncultured Marinobacter sp. TaxID=187379 RepID=UPI002587EFC4|nr:alpha/beta fold hydrolase [uncultured Marinobacter sp.]